MPKLHRVVRDVLEVTRSTLDHNLGRHMQEKAPKATLEEHARRMLEIEESLETGKLTSTARNVIDSEIEAIGGMLRRSRAVLSNIEAMGETRARATWQQGISEGRVFTPFDRYVANLRTSIRTGEERLKALMAALEK